MSRIALVGRDLVPGPWPRPHQKLLQECLTEAGLRPSDYTYAETRGRSLPIANLYVAFGTDAAKALIPDWDGSAQERRGYLFEGLYGKTLVTIHPEDAAKVYVPWRQLLSYDLRRANEQSRDASLVRPKREVLVVGTDCTVERAMRELGGAARIAFDIEIYDSQRVSCIGFAAHPTRGYVFPPRYLREARLLLEGGTRKVAQNGQFDLHFLLTREGIRVANYHDDTLIAWHACYPELAGKEEDAKGKRKNKMTRKSLSFLASLFTLDAWWKDYEFHSDYEMYVLNGRDCCITLDIMEHLDKEIASLDVDAIYRHEISLVWPCVEMQARGLTVDETLRKERLGLLDVRVAQTEERLNDLVLPLLEERLGNLPEEKQHLFKNRKVCDCCRNSSKKRVACWSCAGFGKSPTKKQLLEWAASQGVEVDKKWSRETLDNLLPTCRKCEGAGAFEWFEFNGLSSPQKQILLYDILKLPKRMRDGKLSTDEDALKGLLAHVA